MTVRMSTLAVAGLVGLVGLNIWLLALALGDGPTEPETQASVAMVTQPADALASVAEPPKPKPAAAYSQTLARPLFFKTRTPYVPPPPAPPQAPKPLTAPPPPPIDPGLVLGGVVIMEETRKAYIFNKADSRGAWLSEGETILGWTVESVDAITATLQQRGRSIELQLYPNR